MNNPDQTTPKLKRRFILKPLSVLDLLPSALLVALLTFGQAPTVARLVAQEAPLRYFITQSTGSILSGSADVGNHCDDCVTTIILPFTYKLYDQTFTQVQVGANGTLQFNSGNQAFFNSCVADSGFGYTIFAHWDDLRTDETGGGIFTTIYGAAPNRAFVIEWRAVYFNNRSQRANFEIALYENAPRFDIVYGQIDQSGISATVGVQQGSEYSQFECNAGGLVSGLKLTFAPGGQAPVANLDAYLVDEDTTLSVDPLSGVLANDTDADGNTLSAVLVTLPAQSSSFTFNADGSFIYAPVANFSGTDSFTYKANDGTLDSEVVAVTITVAAVNDPPTFIDAGNVSIAEDFGPAIVSGWAGGINAGAANESGQAVTFQVVGNSNPGLFAFAPAIDPNGNLTFAAAPNANGSSTIAVVAKDNGGTANGGADTSVVHAFTITVTPVNDNPVVADDAVTVNEDSAGNVINVLANDSIAPDVGETLTVVAVTQGAHGSVAIFAGGTAVTYTPAPDFFGSDLFSYTIADGNGGSATATVNVTVLNVNDAPVLNAAQMSVETVNENDFVTMTGSLTDADPDDAHTVTISWGDGTANEVINFPSGQQTFTATHQYLDDQPSSTSWDINTITCTVSDGNGGNATETATVTVKNLAPVITGLAGPTGPLALGSSASVSVNFTDVGTLDTHLVRISWDDGTADTILSTGGFSRSASHIYAAAGVYTVGVSVTDDDTGVAATTYEYIVVYDPSAGFVTGGGWITSPSGAYSADPALSGKASFGFVSKYLKGDNTPSGQTEFQFQVANFDFHSASYEWLVVSGPLAQFKGSGAVNGAGDYGFLLTATDGQATGGGDVDKFRIKIWDNATGAIVYDNAQAGSEDINNTRPQAIGGGSIMIHKGETVANNSSSASRFYRLDQP
jgi:hypothetical protein